VAASPLEGLLGVIHHAMYTLPKRAALGGSQQSLEGFQRQHLCELCMQSRYGVRAASHLREWAAWHVCILLACGGWYCVVASSH
jgi:hypothetical protein